MEPLAKRYLLSWLFVASSLQVTSLHFAEATYICTAYLNVSFIDSVNNETVWRQEESGLYGQQSPKVTVMGDVYLPDPIYSCESNTFYDVPSGSKGWIALIQRGQLCSFSEKINVAASKGAIAAVIFNDLGTDNRVIQMSHPVKAKFNVSSNTFYIYLVANYKKHLTSVIANKGFATKY